MALTRLAFVPVLALALATSASPDQRAQSPTARNEKLDRCDMEGFRALTVARGYFLFGDTKEQVRKSLGPAPDMQAFVEDFFARAQTGRIKHYAYFAAEKLYACADREGIALGAPKSVAEGCYWLADIPYFLLAYRSERPRKEDGIEAVEAILKDRKIYPKELIETTADLVYSSPPPESIPVMRQFFWSCFYDRELIPKK